MISAPKTWEKTFYIHTYHLNPKGLAQLTAICNLLQEGASRHAEARGFGFDDMAKRRQTWVLSRLFVEVERYPAWKEAIKLTTWSRGHEGIFYLRDFILEDERGQIVARATSSWAAINTKTRRPELVEGLEDQLHSIKDKLATGKKLDKLPPLVQPEFLKKHRISYSDIDILYHLNNVKFVEVILNALPLATLMENTIKSIEINYLGESRYDDTLIISKEKNNGGYKTDLINIIKDAGEKEVCRARIIRE